ncbi:golgin subfamily A member 6C-like [Gorilla gorilla gorilla]|uniref:golgin subfamily A member 6C-like n=1 Tax=Gorilla gorilla gorilla TaxID=9595 RepID=UPI00244643DE|nr:golgin subfamily A member 6C-like [Gorilla gorilla gorilla]
MWPQPYLPPDPMMPEETRRNKLAAAKKKLKEYQQRKSPGVPAGAKTKKKKTGSSPKTTTSGGCHSPGDSLYQELAVALESSSVTINQLNENIESLKQQKKQVEHQLEEVIKQIHKAQTEQLETINILTLEKADLKITLYHTKHAARHFEEESKDLAGHLQYALQRIQELERALCAVSTQQQEEDRSLSCKEAVLQWQLQQTIKEQALLNAHVTQVTESLKQVQLEQDEYAKRIKGERARWQERMWKMSVEARTLKEEKKCDIHRIQELERSLSELKNQMAEPLSLVPPAVTSVVEQLQDEAKHLRQEVEGLEGKLQSQVENNQALSVLSKEQKQRLQEQEEKLQEQEEMLREQEAQRVRELERLCEQNERLREQQKTLREQGERLRKQEQRLCTQEERLRKEEERLQKQEKRLWDQEERLWKKEERLQKQEERLVLFRNHKLDKQLAEPQCGFEDLNNEKKSALPLEQQVKELQEKLDEEHLEAASQQDQQLEAQLSLMALPGEGDGGEHLDSEEEEAPQSTPNIPEDLESREATSSFTDLPKEKADGTEQVERRELGFVQPSGVTDGMRESFTVYESQGAVPNTRHQEMEDVIRLAQKEEEMKVNLLELQELVLPLVGNHEGHGKFLTAAQNPADEPAPGAPAPQDLGAASEQDDFYEVSLENNVEPAPGAAREGSPHDNPTAQQIVQLPPVMQDTQEHPGLPSKPCMPFFYQAAENREINIIIF